MSRITVKDLNSLEDRLNKLMEKTSYRFDWGSRYGYKAIDYSYTNSRGTTSHDTLVTGISSSQVASIYQSLIFLARIFNEREDVLDQIKEKLNFMTQ
jgi:hypothetical protein